MSEEIKPVQNKNTTLQSVVKIGAVVLFISVIVFLFFTQLADPTLGTGNIILIILVSLVAFGALFYSFQIYDLLFVKGAKGTGEEGLLPPAITVAQAENLVDRIMMGKKFANYVEEVFDSGPEEHGKERKQKIYFSYFRAKFRDSSGEKPRYFVAINMHYPEFYRIKVNPDEYEMSKIKQRLASDPLDEPDVEETVSENPLQGIRIVTKRTRRDKDTKEKKEENKELK